MASAASCKRYLFFEMDWWAVAVDNALDLGDARNLEPGRGISDPFRCTIPRSSAPRNAHVSSRSSAPATLTTCFLAARIVRLARIQFVALVRTSSRSSAPSNAHVCSQLGSSNAHGSFPRSSHRPLGSDRRRTATAYARCQPSPRKFFPNQRKRTTPSGEGEFPGSKVLADLFLLTIARLTRIMAAATTPNGDPTVSSLATTVPIQAVLFDIDGTLCDSDPLHHVAFQELLLVIGYNNGVPIDEEFFIKNIAGRSDIEAAQNLFPDWELEKGLKFLEEKEERYRSLAKERLVPVKGLEKVVRWVKDHGYKRAAVTNAPRVNAELMISLLGLSDFFQAVIVGGECEKPKPAPYPYLKAIKELNVSAEHTFIFEDSASGIRAGVAAGIPVVAVATRNPEKSLLEAGASLIIKDYEDPKLWAALEEIDREEAKLKNQGSA